MNRLDHLTLTEAVHGKASMCDTHTCVVVTKERIGRFPVIPFTESEWEKLTENLRAAKFLVPDPINELLKGGAK